MTAPCSGLKVFDLTQGYGSIVGMILADYGADVYKIEPPGGDPSRSMPAFYQWNRAKRSVVLDLKNADDRQRFLAAVAGIDVVLHNLRPGAAESLGLGYDQLRVVNKRLVYLAISGFGEHSRFSQYKGYEGIVAAKTGQHLIQGGYRADGPIYDAVFKCSFGAAMLGLIGVLAALHMRELVGSGQRVSTSLVQANFVYSYGGMVSTAKDGAETRPRPQRRDPHNTMPGYRIAECADGQWIQSGSAIGSTFDNLIRALGIDRYFSDGRFRDGPWQSPPDALQELLSWIDEAYKRRPLEEWTQILTEADAGFAPFLTTQEFMDYPQVVHNGHVVDVVDPNVGPMVQIGPLVRISDWQWEWPGPAPRLGEHSLPEPGDPMTSKPDRAPTLRRALEGVTILDLATFAAAPGGPGLLADLGARVIKVEPPQGDPLGVGANHGGELFFRVNRGKERLALDLKDPEGQQIVQQLAASADVVVHNFRPGVPERLGVDYETLRRINERIVYVYAASFGSTGPDSRRPAFDPVISALAGGEVLQAGLGNPPQQRQTTDHSALLGVAVAILLGLRARELTGRGQSIETTMLASAAYLFSDDFIRYADKRARPVPDSGQYGLGALYRLYQASPGWVFLACTTVEEWHSLCEVLGRQDWLSDSRFATESNRKRNEARLAAALQSVFLENSSADWESRLQDARVPCVDATGSWADFMFGGDDYVGGPLITEFEVPGVGVIRQIGAAVTLSDCDNEVGAFETKGASGPRLLKSLGYSDAQIEGLRLRGALG